MYNKSEVRQQIIQYFRAVGSGQNIVQAIKQALFLNEQFNPLLLFERLSQGKQKLTKSDWRRFLISKSIPFSEKEIRYFFRHNHFGQEITLNEFLEALIPYNADVLREFKAKYLDSLEIDNYDPEIEFIFAELMKNWIDFFRNLLQIRSQITHSVTRRQIQHLIKEDLVLKSKPRQSRKFHEAFQQSTFQLSFHQLRKFLEIWLSQKQVIHQFYLLNVKRHIKCENPFEKIVHRSRKQKNISRSRQISQSRSVSDSRSISQSRDNSQKKKRPSSTSKPGNNYKSKEQANSYSPNVEQQAYSNRIGFKGSKYEQFKKQLHDSLVKEKISYGLKAPDFVTSSNKKRTIEINKNKLDVPSNEGERTNNKINQHPQRKQEGINQYPRKKALTKAGSSKVVKIFQQIVLKQSRLEKLRKQLAKNNDFNLANLFKLIDNENKGFVTSEGIKKFTSETNVNYTHMINFYANEKGKLKFKQFTLIFRPLSKQLNENLDNKPQPRQATQFKKQTARLIIEIMQLENDMHSNLNNYRRQIKQQQIEPKELFQSLDSQAKGFISSDNIKELLEENNINCEPKDLKCLMKLFDKKIDEKVLLKDFLKFMDL